MPLPSATRPLSKRRSNLGQIYFVHFPNFTYRVCDIVNKFPMLTCDLWACMLFNAQLEWKASFSPQSQSPQLDVTY